MFCWLKTIQHYFIVQVINAHHYEDKNWHLKLGREKDVKDNSDSNIVRHQRK